MQFSSSPKHIWLDWDLGQVVLGTDIWLDWDLERVVLGTDWYKDIFIHFHDFTFYLFIL